MFWIIRMHRSMMSFLLLTSFLTAGSDSIYKEFDCVVTPSNVADLGSNARGVIADVLVDRNDFLKQGEVIATLDAEVEHAMVEIAREQASIDTEIALRKVNLTYAKREEERAQSAFEEKAFSIHDLDTAKVNRELAHIKLLQAEENKLLAKKKLKEAEARLAHKTIRAPFAGVVMERFKTIGEYIDDDPVVRLAQLDPLYVEIIVPVEEENNIKVGMTANICSDRNEGRGWDVSVVQVDEVIDAASGTFGVRLLLPNPDYKIPAGLRCNLRFIEELNSIEKKKPEGVTSRHG